MTVCNIVLNYLQLYHKVVRCTMNSCKKNALQTCEMFLSQTEDVVQPGSLQETCGTQGKGACFGLSYWGLVGRKTVFFKKKPLFSQVPTLHGKRNMTYESTSSSKDRPCRQRAGGLLAPFARWVVASFCQWSHQTRRWSSAQPPCCEGKVRPEQTQESTSYFKWCWLPGEASGVSCSQIQVHSSVHLDRPDTPSRSICTGLNDNATHSALHSSISASEL